MRRILSIIIACLCVTFWSCTNPTPPADNPPASTETGKSIAILKVQDAPYNAQHKDSLMAAYVDQQKLDVPNDLMPQNKWVMFEGPVLENELIAYRFYADHRHRTDIYGKQVSDFVMDTVSWDYHNIMDWGSDILKVGNSLGIGAPAILHEDSIYTFSHYGSKSISKIVDGDRSGFEFQFNDLVIGSDTLNLVQQWTLAPGRPHAKISIQITDGTLPAGAQFCTGIVKHLESYEIASNDTHKAIYTYGKQSFHKEVLAMAIVVPKVTQVNYLNDQDSHVWVFADHTDGVTYEFAAAWERDLQGMENKEDFEHILFH